ncbi:ZNF22 protein, partial [Calonectris borealis]|nr:ZNF22 protein [Calonectris borealis]
RGRCARRGPEPPPSKPKEAKGGKKPPAAEVPNTGAECWQRFGQSSDLVTHLRLHTRAQPSAAPHCGKRFSRSSHHKRHERTHAG